MGGGMCGTTAAFAHVKIDALLKEAGLNVTGGVSVLLEHAPPDGTRANYVLCPGPVECGNRAKPRIR